MKILFFLLSILCGVSTGMGYARNRVDTTFLSVKDFGAVGNGKKDDAEAIIRCLTAGTRHSGPVVVHIPYGVYKIDHSIKININKCSILAIRGVPKGNKLPLIKTNDFINILEVYSGDWDPKGKVSISNLFLRGNNRPFSPSHPYFDKPASRNGISVLNLKEVTIFNNYVTNVYGNGINIAYSSNLFKNLDDRFDNVVIKNNHILNCWGLHPTRIDGKSYDDYGDGIYTNSIKQGVIQGNTIINDLRQTKQFGRSGITLEYNDENCRVTHNYIFGYDRDMHIEADIGGHVIAHNTLEGSDFGILVYDVPLTRNKPIQIVSNDISNKGLPLHNNYTRVRNSEERALLSFYARGDCRAGSVIRDNRFVIENGYAFTYSSVVRFLADGLIVKHNSFISHLPVNNRKTVRFYQPVDSVVGNRFDNVDVFFTKRGTKAVVSDNKIAGEVNTNKKL